MSFMRRHALLMFVVLAIVATATPITPLFGAEGSKRLALVIGNSAYENVAPLINPANDATDIAQKLKSLGFDVLLATNADQAKMTSPPAGVQEPTDAGARGAHLLCRPRRDREQRELPHPGRRTRGDRPRREGRPACGSGAPAPREHGVRAFAARRGKDRDCVPRCLQDERGPTRFEPEGRLSADQPRGADTARNRLDGNKAEPVFRRASFAPMPRSSTTSPPMAPAATVRSRRH